MLTYSQMTRAARLRASGHSWAQIAHEFEIREAKLLRWTRKHAERWERCYRDAVQSIARECLAEAVLYLRRDMREEKGRDRRDAASKLIQFAQRAERNCERDPDAPPTLSPTIFRIAEYVQSLNDDQLHDFVRELDVARASLTESKPITPE